MLFAIQFEVPLLFLYHHVFSTSESENYKQHSTSSQIYREQLHTMEESFTRLTFLHSKLDGHNARNGTEFRDLKMCFSKLTYF